MSPITASSIVSIWIKAILWSFSKNLKAITWPYLENSSLSSSPFTSGLQQRRSYNIPHALHMFTLSVCIKLYTESMVANSRATHFRSQVTQYLKLGKPLPLLTPYTHCLVNENHIPYATNRYYYYHCLRWLVRTHGMLDRCSVADGG